MKLRQTKSFERLRFMYLKEDEYMIGGPLTKNNILMSEE